MPSSKFIPFSQHPHNPYLYYIPAVKMRIQNTLVLLLLLLCRIAAQSQSLPELIPLPDGNLWGYADTSGHVKIKPQWRMAEPFRNGRALVYTTSGRGYINKKGEYLIAPWRQFGRDSTGYADLFTTWQKARLNALGKNGKYGIIDSDGHELIPCIYDRAWAGTGAFVWSNILHCYVAVMRKNGKVGIIDTANKTLIPFQYDELSDPANGWIPPRYYIFRQHGKYGLIDTGNNTLIPPVYDVIHFYGRSTDRGIRLVKNEHAVIADSNGKIQIDIPGYWAGFPYDTLIPVLRKIPGQIPGVGLMNNRHQLLLPCVYADVTPGKDTIEVIKDSSDGKNNKMQLFRFLSTKTLQPISGWLTDKQHSALKGYDTSQQWNKPPSMPRYGLKLWVKGKELDEYKKDSIRWAVTAYSYFRDAVYFSVRGFAPGEDTPTYSAVLDTSGNYVIPSKKTRNNFRIINPTDSIVAVEYPMPPAKLQPTDYPEYEEEDPRGRKVDQPPYGNDKRMADYNLHTIMPRNQLNIASAFYYNGTFYAIAEHDTFVETTHYGNPLNHVKQSIRKLVDANGSPLPALAQYNLIKYVGSTGNDPMPSSFYSVSGFNKPFIGYFLVEDSTRKRGIVDIFGNIQMPAVSFKYTGLEPIGNGLFVAQHTPRNQYFEEQKFYEPPSKEPHREVPNRGEPWLVDSLNHVLLDSLTLGGIKLTAKPGEAPIYTAYLQKVFSDKYGNSETVWFYVDGRGRGYYKKLRGDKKRTTEKQSKTSTRK